MYQDGNDCADLDSDGYSIICVRVGTFVRRNKQTKNSVGKGIERYRNAINNGHGT